MGPLWHDVVLKKHPVDLLVTGGTVLNVFSGTWEQTSFGVFQGRIVGFGDYEAQETFDASGKWIVPGLIDAHIHIESTMLKPSEFARAILRHGVTTVVTDPHEIANVHGLVGVQWMLEESENVGLDVLVQFPSCVPAVSFEMNGATLTSAHMPTVMQHPRMIGLAEVMDWPSLFDSSSDMQTKIKQTKAYGKVVDGHCAGLTERQIGAYRALGVTTDHEATTRAEAEMRVRSGLYTLVREGSAAKNLDAILPAVTPYNSRHFMFCTDDKHIHDLIEEGTINHTIVKAMRSGLDPITAIAMGSLNAANAYRLHDRGAILPSYVANFVVLNEVETWDVSNVFAHGVQVYDGEEVTL
ncbi:MAG: amidohydrolase family protein, partial [Bacilli bacterium]